MNEDTKKEKGAELKALDQLLADAEQLQAKSALKSEKATTSKSKKAVLSEVADNLESIQANLHFTKTAILTIKESYLGFHERFLAPLGFIFAPPLRCLANCYAKFWNRFAYVTKENGERELSRKRAGIVVGLSLCTLLAVTPTGIGDRIRFVTTEPIIDGMLIAISKNNETFFLSNTEEIDPEYNIHSVRGCKSGGQCSEADAAYFRVKPRLSHDIWKLVVHGNPFYIPDHVVAPIAPGVNKCQVTYYGYRLSSSWISRMLRSLQVYPIMLETSCEHLGSGGSRGVE